MQVAVVAGNSAAAVINSHHLQHLHLHPGGSRLHITELDCGTVGQIDHPVGVEGTAIVYPNDDALAVAEVRYPGVTGDRQGFVRGAGQVQVVDLAVGRLMAMELGAVPGGRALYPVALVVGQYFIGHPVYGVRAGIAH